MNLENGYQEKILVFFDILGFKDLVTKKYKDDPEKIEEILSTMHILSTTSYPSELIIFSDSVINILEVNPYLKEHGKNFSQYLNVILSDIATIQMNMLLLYGVLIRGSIVIGNIKHKNEMNLLFGPALIDAYELESKHSIYPRFILDEKIIELIKNDTEWMYVSQDLDGHYYVDSFNKWLVEFEKKEKLDIKEKIENEINNLGKNPNLGVLSKYRWLLNKIIKRDNII
ncbi:hypothetical protein COE30_26035 [Bacillus cereus]|uniref:hypothetical protein n=1 Tax=Bacillus cereus TaxID=1396 RepID=UPI000BFD77A9|nr:hypothetical protein [Bacillus cereus]PGZ00158.1 hypothetical protein COE30_26035 [Bacillus cereus]